MNTDSLTYNDNQLFPLVSSGFAGHESTLVTTMPRAGSNGSTQMTFALGTNMDAVGARLVVNYFEGLNVEKKTENCIKRFEKMINNVSPRDIKTRTASLTDLCSVTASQKVRNSVP